jgi:hypothetical protein
MSQPSLVSPNVGNYYIGKGICSIKLPGDADYIDCGNVPTFEFLAKVTQLDHFSSRSGVKIKDFSAVTELSGTLTMILEEFTARNLGFALMGDVTMPGGSPDAENISIDIFTNAVIQGAVKFVGKNDIGAQATVIFPLVQFTPSKALALIGSTWGTIDLAGDVLADPVTGSFGTCTLAGVPTSPSDVT